MQETAAYAIYEKEKLWNINVSLFNFILETNNTFVKGWSNRKRFLEKQNNCFQITKIYYCNKIMSQVTLTLRLFVTALIFMTKYRENYIGLDLLAGLLWPGLFKPICIVPHPLSSTQGKQFTCRLTRKEAVKVLFKKKKVYNIKSKKSIRISNRGNWNNSTREGRQRRQNTQKCFLWSLNVLNRVTYGSEMQ